MAGRPPVGNVFSVKPIAQGALAHDREEHGCKLYRKGGNHAIYVNSRSDRSSAVPRHREVNEFLARKICDDLQVPGK